MNYAKTLALTSIPMLLSACIYAAKPPVMPNNMDFRIIPAKINLPNQQGTIGRLKYRGGIGLQSSNKRFGGFSGLHISNNLQNLTAIGWGSWLTGQLNYDQSGKLNGFSNKQEHPIINFSGKPVAVDNDQDAESLFFDGQYYYVGFENNNRIWRYKHINGVPKKINLPRQALSGIPAWGGFSSVTATQEGKLVTLTEGGKDPSGNTKGWIGSPDSSAGTAIYLRASKDWLPVDLARLPNGDLLLAETWSKGTPKGYHNRLSRIDKSEVKAGNIMQAQLIAALSPPVYYKKIEGVHAVKDPQGKTLIFTIADTANHWPTDIMMFELP